MKLTLIFALLMALPVFADIEGTTTVRAPIAPPAVNSNFPAVDDQFVGGGFRVSFENIGDWNDTALLPSGRMRTNMVVRARNDPQHRSYRCISISPRVFEPDTDVVLKAQVDALAATVSGITVGTSTNSLLIVDNVAAMLLIPHARLTNGPVIVHTLSRNSGRIGGSDFVFDIASTATANLGAIFTHPSGGRFLCIGADPGDIDLYGADSTSVTDSTAAMQSAVDYATSIKRRAYWPGRTYYMTTVNTPANAELDFSPDAVVRLFSYPTYPGGSTSLQPDLVKGMFNLADKTIMRLKGATLDCRAGAFSATSFTHTAIRIRDATDVEIIGGRLLNCWRYSINVRYSTNVTLTDLVTEGSYSVGQVSMSKNVRLIRGMSLNQVFNNPNYAQHIWDFNGNENTTVDGYIVRNALATSAGSSYAFSGFTGGGEIGAVFTHMIFEPPNDAMDINGAAMLLDGCYNTIFSDSDITGWNVGQSTLVEVASPRNVTLRSLRINGPKNYATYRNTGGAGIFIIDNGIWPEDNGSWKWNEAGWQWRARSAGSGVLIDDCDISRCFDGVLFTSSYSTIRNCRIYGNLNNGITVGRPGNGGSSSFGWVNPTTHRTFGCRIINNDISWNGANGIGLEKFAELAISGNTISRNNQNGGGYAGIGCIGSVDQGNVYLRDNFIGNPPALTITDGFSLDPSQPQWTVRSSRTTAAGTTAGSIKTTTPFTAMSYNRLYLRYPATGSTARILRRDPYSVNHVGTYATGTTSIALASGTGAINVGDVITFEGDPTGYTVATALTSGTVVIASPGLTQTLANGAAVSYQTSQLDLESNLGSNPGTGAAVDIIEVPIYRISVTKQEEIIPGQRINLPGVQVGGVDMPVMVTHTDFKHNDEFLAIPVGASTVFGTYTLLGWQTTAGGSVIAGTGTMSYTYQGAAYYNPQAALKVTMSVAASGELDNPYWIGVDPGTGTYEWRRVQRSLGWGGVTTELYVDRPFSQSFTGKAFRFSKIDGAINEPGIGQSWGIDLPSFTGKLFIMGDGNSFPGNLNAAAIRGVGSPDVPYARIPDSSTPTIPDQGDRFQIAFTTARTITSMGGGWESRHFRMFYLTGFAPTFDCTSNANMTTSDGLDHTLSVGDTVDATYTNGKWTLIFTK